MAALASGAGLAAAASVREIIIETSILKASSRAQAA